MSRDPSNPRFERVLLLGGWFDGERPEVDVDSRYVRLPIREITNGVALYHLTQMGSTDARFTIGVIDGKHQDGAWMMDRLIAGYRNPARPEKD